MGEHSHRHAGHEQHPSACQRRPITGLSSETVQPHGNAAQQQQANESSESNGRWLLDWVDDAADSLTYWWSGEEWWAKYAASAEVARQDMALSAWRDDDLQMYIDGLTEQQTLSDYRNELGDVLDYLQHLEMMKAAGMTWEQMADAQQGWMEQQARERAGVEEGEVATDEELAAGHAEAVADQEYYSSTEPEDTVWASFSESEKKAWRVRARAAIQTFVTWTDTHHPELEITDSEIRPALKACEEMDAVAFVQSDVCHISMAVVEAVERDPAYALSTIQHELRGHLEFDTGFSIGMELYDASTQGMEGYTRPDPDSEEAEQEWARYDYFESEIGALLRENSYWVDSRDLDGDGKVTEEEQNPLGAPLDLLESVLGDLEGNWEPTVLIAHLTGMRKRFEADPRVGAEAVAAFVSTSESVLGLTP